MVEKWIHRKSDSIISYVFTVPVIVDGQEYHKAPGGIESLTFWAVHPRWSKAIVPQGENNSGRWGECWPAEGKIKHAIL